jgi:hypothetical protein
LGRINRQEGRGASVFLPLLPHYQVVGWQRLHSSSCACCHQVSPLRQPQVSLWFHGAPFLSPLGPRRVKEGSLVLLVLWTLAIP